MKTAVDALRVDRRFHFSKMLIKLVSDLRQRQGLPEIGHQFRAGGGRQQRAGGAVQNHLLHVGQAQADGSTAAAYSLLKVMSLTAGSSVFSVASSPSSSIRRSG